jgi:hypothetical protein
VSRHPNHERDATAGSRFDRLALRIARRSPTPVSAPAPVPGDGGQLSRRKVLTTALGAGAAVMVPLRLADPTTARADGYCAAECLNDANATSVAGFTSCEKAAFGVALPTPDDVTAYVASKIKFGGLGALLLITETARYDVCVVGNEIRYNRQAGKCGEPNCGDAKKYPPGATTACDGCHPGFHCCVCRDYTGKLLPNTLVNGGFSCASFCMEQGFTVVSDKPC